MKVYVVMGHVSHEGSDIVAIFSNATAAEARRAIEEERAKTEYDIDWCTVEEWDVQS